MLVIKFCLISVVLRFSFLAFQEILVMFLVIQFISISWLLSIVALASFGYGELGQTDKKRKKAKSLVWPSYWRGQLEISAFSHLFLLSLNCFQIGEKIIHPRFYSFLCKLSCLSCIQINIDASYISSLISFFCPSASTLNLIFLIALSRIIMSAKGL